MYQPKAKDDIGKSGGAGQSCVCAQRDCDVCNPQIMQRSESLSSTETRAANLDDDDVQSPLLTSVPSPRDDDISDANTSPRSLENSPTVSQRHLISSPGKRSSQATGTSLRRRGNTANTTDASTSPRGGPILPRTSSSEKHSALLAGPSVNSADILSPNSPHSPTSFQPLAQQQSGSTHSTHSSSPLRQQRILPPLALESDSDDEAIAGAAVVPINNEPAMGEVAPAATLPVAKTYSDYIRIIAFAFIEILISAFRAGIIGYAVAHISLFGLAILGFWPGMIFMAISFYCLLPVYWGNMAETDVSFKRLKHIVKDPWLLLGAVCCLATGVSLGFKMWYSMLAMVTIASIPTWALIVLGLLLAVACLGFIANAMQSWEKFCEYWRNAENRKRFKDLFDFKQRPLRSLFIVLVLGVWCAAAIIATMATVGAWMTGLKTAGILHDVVTGGFYIFITFATLIARLVYTLHQALSQFIAVCKTVLAACKWAWENPRLVIERMKYPVQHPWQASCWLGNQIMLLFNAIGNAFVAAEGITQPVFGLNCFIYAASPLAAGINSYSTCAYFQKPQHPILALIKAIVTWCVPWVKKGVALLKATWRSCFDTSNAYRRQQDEEQPPQPPVPPQSQVPAVALNDLRHILPAPVFSASAEQRSRTLYPLRPTHPTRESGLKFFPAENLSYSSPVVPAPVTNTMPVSATVLSTQTTSRISLLHALQSATSFGSPPQQEVTQGCRAAENSSANPTSFTVPSPPVFTPV